MADIFVSYTSADRDWAFWIGQELLKFGHTPRIDAWEISGGGDIAAWMEERHQKADHILCVISKTYLGMPYASWERRAAQWAAQTGRLNFILPVRIEQCELPTLLASVKGCDLFGVEEKESRDRLLDFLKPAGKPTTQASFPGEMRPKEKASFPGATSKTVDELAEIGSLDESDLPHPPKLAALPRYLGSHQFIGRSLELQTLTDWCDAADPNPMLVFEAIGGSGKSMLAWEWLTNRAEVARGDWAGLLWYSFYEQGALMADFCRQALSYMTRLPVRSFRNRNMRQLSDLIIKEFEKRPWLIVLDGLERILVAYHRHDSVQMLDAEVDDTSDQFGKRDPRAAIRSDDDMLLRRLAGAAPSKILVTSRLSPRVFINSSRTVVPGVRREMLYGLRSTDAEAMIRQCGVTGNTNRIREYLQINCGCHPLVVGALAGLINDYPNARGDFDRWAIDPNYGAALNLGDLDLVQRRTHILFAAIDALQPSARRLLHLLSLLRGSVDFETLRALAQQTASSKIRQPKGGSAEDPAADLGHTIRDLERRGLLQYDASGRRYDLHPVVRGIAVAWMPKGDTLQLGQRVVNHFNSRAHSAWDKAETLDDVADGIQVVSTLTRIGNFAGAFEALITGGLSNALMFNLDARAEALSLFKAFYSDGWMGDLPLADRVKQSWILNETAMCLSGDFGAAAELLYERAIRLCIAETLIDTLYIVLCNFTNLISQDRLADVARLNSLASELVQFSDQPNLAFLSLLNSFGLAVAIGDHGTADRLWDQIEIAGRNWSRGIYRPGDAEKERATDLFIRGKLTEKVLRNAEMSAVAGKNRAAIQALHALRAEWHLVNEEPTPAIDHFSQALTMMRERGNEDAHCEARLALARLRAGEKFDAQGEAERLSVAETACGAVAELWHEIGHNDRALTLALRAHRKAAGQGFPHVQKYRLDKVGLLFTKLGAPLPSVEKYDISTLKPFPWEQDLRTFISELRSPSR